MVFGDKSYDKWWYPLLLSPNLIATVVCVALICAFEQDSSITTFKVSAVHIAEGFDLIHFSEI